MEIDNNGGSYNIGQAIIEAAEELQVPLIILYCEPRLEYCVYDDAGILIRLLAANINIPIASAFAHGKPLQSVFRAVRVGFTPVIIDYTDKPLADNIRGTQEIVNLVRPPGISEGRKLARSSKVRTTPGNARQPWAPRRQKHLPPEWTWTYSP